MKSFQSNHTQALSERKMVSSSPTPIPSNHQNSVLPFIGCANVASDHTKQKNTPQSGKKNEVCDIILKRLRHMNHEDSFSSLEFGDSIRAHFNRLPYRYALDVNIERAEDVLTHKRLLQLAKDPKNRPAFNVRSVHVLISGPENLGDSSLKKNGISQHFSRPTSLHPPPAFGSSPNLEAFVLELNKSSFNDDDGKENDDSGHSSAKFSHVPMHEVTFSSVDEPKLLCKLSSLLADIGLNIREAHVFSTDDGYSLDVFVVDGWPTENVEELHQALENAIAGVEETYWEGVSPTASPARTIKKPDTQHVEYLKILSDGANDWEIDYNQLKLNCKVASGAFGDLYKGTYCGQEVAIKVLKPDRMSNDMQKEFAQEVYIMRKVRHKNVVQFIGACTKPLHLCIVTEFMSGGSVHDYLHKRRGVFKVPEVIKVGIDISKGMDYLHQHNIIHRDLKAANLLMNEHEVVKVADFGVARVQSQTGIMTAETGTYRWMAPEVIEHKPYDRKADVFSFGIVLWELLTGKIPYEYLTPLQAAVGVVQKGLRPTIPKGSNPSLSGLLEKCWKQDPKERPDFSEITIILQDILKEVTNADKEKKVGFLSAFKRV